MINYYAYKVTQNEDDFREQKDHRIWNAIKLGVRTYGIFEKPPSELDKNIYGLELVGESKTLDGTLKAISKSKKKDSNRVRNKDKRILFLRMSFLGCQKNRTTGEESELNVLRKIFDGVEGI